MPSFAAQMDGWGRSFSCSHSPLIAADGQVSQPAAQRREYVDEDLAPIAGYSSRWDREFAHSNVNYNRRTVGMMALVTGTGWLVFLLTYVATLSIESGGVQAGLHEYRKQDTVDMWATFAFVATCYAAFAVFRLPPLQSFVCLSAFYCCILLLLLAV